MGDYNVQIISAKFNIPKEKYEAFKQEVESKLRMTDSAYHATAPFISWREPSYDGLILSAVVQAKYNRGMIELLDWLEPQVDQGMGLGEAWSINFSEYSVEPQIRYLNPNAGKDQY